MRRKPEQVKSALANQTLEKLQIARYQVDSHSKINFLFGTAVVLMNLYLASSSEELEEKILNYFSLVVSLLILGVTASIFSKKNHEFIPADFLNEIPESLITENGDAKFLSASFALSLLFGSYSVLGYSSGCPFFFITPFILSSSDLVMRKITDRAQAQIRRQDKIHEAIEKNLRDAFGRVRFGKNSLGKYFYIQRNPAGLIISLHAKTSLPDLFPSLLIEHFAQFGLRALFRDGQMHVSLTRSSLLHHRLLFNEDLIKPLDLEGLIEKIHYAEEALNFIKSLVGDGAQVAREGRDFLVTGLTKEPALPDLRGAAVKTLAQDGTWELRLTWDDVNVFKAISEYQRASLQRVPEIFRGSAPEWPSAERLAGQPAPMKEGEKVKTRRGPPSKVLSADEPKPEPILCFGKYGVYDSSRVGLSDPTQIKRLEFNEKGRKFVVYVCATDEIARMFERGAWENLQVTSQKGALERYLSLDIKGGRKCNGNSIWATVCKHQQHHIISTEAFELQFPPNTEGQPRSFFVLLNDSARASLLTDNPRGAALEKLAVEYYRESAPAMRR